MSNAIRSGIAATRIDRRKVLHRSAAGLAISALAAAGRPAGGAAHSTIENARSSTGVRWADIGYERRGTITGTA